MSTSEPETRTVTLDEARDHLDQLVDEVATEGIHVRIERDGQPLARLEPTVSAKQREIEAMLEDPTFRDLATLGLVFQDVPLDELEHEVARALQEGRNRRRKMHDSTSSSRPNSTC